MAGEGDDDDSGEEMKHIIHRSATPQIPMNYDANMTIDVTGGDVIITTCGERGGVHGYICLDPAEFRHLIGSMIADDTLCSLEERRALVDFVVRLGE